MIIDNKYTLTMSDLKNGILHEDFYKCENIGKWDSAYDDEINRINKNGFFKEFIKDIYDDLKDYYDYKDDNEIIKEIDFIKVMYNLFNDENYMSNNYINQKRYEEEINKSINVSDIKKEEVNMIKICDTPEVLLEIGLKQKPMLYSKSHLRDAIKEKNEQKHTHGLTLEQIYKFPELIRNPAAIIKSQIKDNICILLLNEVDEDKLPLMAFIKKDEKGNYEFNRIDTNLVKSIYGKNCVEELLTIAKNNKNLLFIDTDVVNQISKKANLNLEKFINDNSKNQIL